MMKKRIIAFNTALLIGFSSYIGIPSASAAKDPVKQAEVDQAQAALNEVQAEISTLNQRIAQIDKAVKDNQNMINNTEENIIKTEKQVKTLDEEINKLEEKNEKRQEILKQRAVTYQQTSGTNSYLEVIFGSSSFGDFIERVGAVSTIVQADRELIDEIQKDQNDLEEKQSTVEEKLASLKDMKTELVGMQQDIKLQQDQTNSLKETLKAKEEDSQRKLAEAKAKNIDIVIEPVVVAAETSNVKEKVEKIADSQKEETTNVSANSKEETSAKPANSSNKKPSTNNSSPTNKPSYTTGNTQNKNIQTVITAGNRYIGNSVYVFGGGRTAADVAAGRFDCSGFVSWAFKQGGYSVPASTDALKYAGRQIPTSQMQPGDMVFFDTYKKDGHVGIYIGGGKFIGSQSSTGVAKASLTSGYWKTVFNGRVVRVH